MRAARGRTEGNKIKASRSNTKRVLEPVGRLFHWFRIPDFRRKVERPRVPKKFNPMVIEALNRVNP